MIRDTSSCSANALLFPQREFPFYRPIQRDSVGNSTKSVKMPRTFAKSEREVKRENIPREPVIILNQMEHRPLSDELIEEYNLASKITKRKNLNVDGKDRNLGFLLRTVKIAIRTRSNSLRATAKAAQNSRDDLSFTRSRLGHRKRLRSMVIYRCVEDVRVAYDDPEA